VAEKTVKTKQPEKTKQQGENAVQVEKSRQIEKSKPAQKAVRAADKDREKPKQPNAIARWYRETVGELRKVAWPTIPETRRLTIIVLIVMFSMSAVLGLLDFLFSRVIALLIS
jgi:preprotein translocase subunit SecE